MNELVPLSADLSALVKKAADRLASATTAAEILDARDWASVAYDAAKKARRLAIAKAAHDEVVVKAARAQADALDIEASAKRRLADEYDAAQDRGEIRKQGGDQTSKSEVCSVADFPGLSHKAIHEARLIRDAERSDPGIIRRTIDVEPTRAAISRAIHPKPEPRKPLVADDALWLWGRLRDFQLFGYFEKPPADLLGNMTGAMRADVLELAPQVIKFLKTLERPAA